MKEKILVISFMIVIFAFMFFNIFSKKEEISYYERRKLTDLPDITLTGLLNKESTTELDEYIADHFIFRNNFRKLKTDTEILLGKTDINDLFYYKNHYFKYEKVYNEKQINKFTEKINYIYDNYLKGMNVYYSIIPEKNYYLDSDKYKKFDYNSLFKNMDNINKQIIYIDITDTIDLNSYYYTDHHLKQDKIIKAIQKLSTIMNFSFDDNYKIEEYYPFYGTYYGQLLIKKDGEKLNILHNNIIDNATVNNIQSDYDKIYDDKKFGTVDSYDIFLSGATAYEEIINNNIESGKELIVFRDSYASSFAPLMLSGYKKITLIDLRYGNLEYLMDKIELNNQDILFLYSTSIINGSDVLRVY